MRHHFTMAGVLGLAMIAATAVAPAAFPAAAVAGTPGPRPSITQDVTLLAATEVPPSAGTYPFALPPEPDAEIAFSTIFQGCRYPHIWFLDHYDQLCTGYSPTFEGLTDERSDVKAKALAESFLDQWQVEYGVTCVINDQESSYAPAEGGSQYNLYSICYNPRTDFPGLEPQPQPDGPLDFCPLKDIDIFACSDF